MHLAAMKVATSVGIHNLVGIDSRQKHSGMTDFRSPGRDQNDFELHFLAISSELKNRNKNESTFRKNQSKFRRTERLKF